MKALEMTDAQKLAADVNKDSKIDSIDASCVLSYYSHLSTGGKLSLESFLNGSPASYSIDNYPLYKSQLSFINANSSDYYACLNAEISTHYSYDAEKKYALLDLNGDKKPELIITTSTLGSGAPDIAEIYTISGNKLVRICQGYDRSWYYLCENNVIACSSVYGNGHGMAYYKYNGGSKLDTIEWFNYDYYTGSLVLIYSDGINQKTISESEAQAIQAKYKDIRYELITF